MDAQVVHVSRESVLMTWTMAEGAVAYMVARRGPLVPGQDSPDEVILAACYEPVFCDAVLEPGSRYQYRIEQIRDESTEEIDQQFLRIRTLPETEFPDSRTFFEQFLATTFARDRQASIGVRWCEQWWLHAEAQYVVDQLWASYEALRSPEPPDPPGKQRAEWLVAFAYPLLDRLFAQKACFEGCANTGREKDGVMHAPKVLPLPSGRPPLPVVASDSDDPGPTMTA